MRSRSFGRRVVTARQVVELARDARDRFRVRMETMLESTVDGRPPMTVLIVLERAYERAAQGFLDAGGTVSAWNLHGPHGLLEVVRAAAKDPEQWSRLVAAHSRTSGGAA